MDKKYKRIKSQKDNISPNSISIGEDYLGAITGGHGEANDYYDPFRCFLPMPDSRCHIRNGGIRCCHLTIEQIGDNIATQKYRYICTKGCFDYVSDCELH